jgi:hypothetical protein
MKAQGRIWLCIEEWERAMSFECECEYECALSSLLYK